MYDDLRLSSRKIISSITLLWLLLWFGSVLQDLVLYSTGSEGKVWLLDVDSEDSLYTWFSTVILSVAAMFAFVLGSQGDDRWQWRAIALILLAMSTDEMLSLHEKLSGILSTLQPTSGMFYFAWVIPALVLVVAVGITFLPFVLRLPRNIALTIILSAALFVMGALGLEMITGIFLSGSDDQTTAFQSPLYRLLTNLEEGLEGLGVVLFIAALLARCTQVFPANFSKV